MLCLLGFLVAKLAGALLAEVVEFCASNLGDTDKFNLRQERRVQRENTFDRHAFGDFTNRKRAVHACTAFEGNNHAFKNLRTGLVAVLNRLVNADGLSRLEFRVL